MEVLGTTTKRNLRTLAVLLAMGLRLGAQDLAADEYQVKAAFLYNFAKFVEWPKEAFAGNSRITICVLGNSSFAALVSNAVMGKQVENRGFTTQVISAEPAPGTCHILFVSNTEQKRQGALLRQLKDPYLLTVGESDDFLMSGGVINLKLKQASVRIEINTAAAVQLKFRISSKLLSLAEATKR